MIDAHNFRVSKANRIPVPDDASEDESELQSRIRQWCAQNGWTCLGGSMAHRTRRTVGEPDLIVVGSQRGDPVIRFVECKTRLGKLSPAQRAVAAGLARHGVTVHIARSMSDFIAITQ
jgi:Holliday junction resolvase-like predicted endonuclease